MASFDFTGKTALVTGAGGGIGRNIALGLAKRGVRGLALCDIREDLVRETASLAQALGARVSVHVFDIADRCAIEALPAQVRDEHASIEVLVNNAGVTLGGHFDAGTIDEFEWVLTINLLGVTRMTRVFLPQLKQVPAAQIINNIKLRTARKCGRRHTKVSMISSIVKCKSTLLLPNFLDLFKLRTPSTITTDETTCITRFQDTDTNETHI